MFDVKNSVHDLYDPHEQSGPVPFFAWVFPGVSTRRFPNGRVCEGTVRGPVPRF